MAEANKCILCGGELGLQKNENQIYELRCKTCGNHYASVDKELGMRIENGRVVSVEIVGQCRKTYLEGKWNDGESDITSAD